MINVFAYGTLRPSLYPARAPSVGNARLTKIKGPFRMYNLGRFPALVWGDDWQGEIVGEVIEVEDLDALDRYEGYLPNGRGLYDRTRVEVLCGEEKRVAWVYFMHEEAFDGGTMWREFIESGDWADVLRSGKART